MVSETLTLQPITPSYHVRILEDEQLDQLQNATLEILEQVGIHCPSDRGAAYLCRAWWAGAIFTTRWLNCPKTVILEAMSHAPRFYTMGARDPAFDLNLDGKSLCIVPRMGVVWRRSISSPASEEPQKKMM